MPHRDLGNSVHFNKQAEDPSGLFFNDAEMYENKKREYAGREDNELKALWLLNNRRTANGSFMLAAAHHDLNDNVERSLPRNLLSFDYTYSSTTCPTASASTSASCEEPQNMAEILNPKTSEMCVAPFNSEGRAASHHKFLVSDPTPYAFKNLNTEPNGMLSKKKPPVPLEKSKLDNVTRQNSFNSVEVHRVPKQNSTPHPSSGKHLNKRSSAPHHSVRMQLCRTKFCPFKLMGDCLHSDTCSYAHSKEELRPLPDLHKTKLCEAVKRGTVCSKKDCAYAHSFVELRLSSDLVTYKTSLCFFWRKGRCLNQSKCRFAHGLDDLRVKFPNPFLASTSRGTSDKEGSVYTLSKTETKKDKECDLFLKQDESTHKLNMAPLFQPQDATREGAFTSVPIDEMILRSSEMLRMKEILSMHHVECQSKSFEMFQTHYKDSLLPSQMMSGNLEDCPKTFLMESWNPFNMDEMNCTMDFGPQLFHSSDQMTWTNGSVHESFTNGTLLQNTCSTLESDNYSKSSKSFGKTASLHDRETRVLLQDCGENLFTDMDKLRFSRSMSLLSTQPTLSDGIDESAKNNWNFPFSVSSQSNVKITYSNSTTSQSSNLNITPILHPNPLAPQGKSDLQELDDLLKEIDFRII